MKLFLDYELNESGKGKFLQKLIPALERIGVKTYYEQKGCDVALGISRWRTNIKIPKVVRVDGIHLKENDKNDWKNQRIKKAIKKSDAVIYQSEYAKWEVIKKFNFRKKYEFVIFNGADPKDYDVKPIDTKSNYTIIASAKWCHRNGYRKHKRLKTVIKVAEYMRSKRDDIHFYIAGRLLDTFEDTENLTFLGQLEDKELRRYLHTADIMLYPAKYDWCPNACIEAICANTPIICTEGHGVAELVRACGGRIVNNTIDIIEIFVHINALLEYPLAVNTEPVHIDTIAGQYKKAFEAVL